MVVITSQEMHKATLAMTSPNLLSNFTDASTFFDMEWGYEQMKHVT